MASTVASSVVFGCGDVDLTLLQYGSISDGGGGGGVGAGTGTGGDGNLHLSQDGEGGGDDDKNDDCSLSEGGATISLAIAASMTGGRDPPQMGPPPRGPPLRVPPLTPLGRSRMA
nr:hypothetical protein [Tanacetum cinerariifolium]